MLLSSVALEQLQKMESQSKCERIRSFIREQKQHLPYYTPVPDVIDYIPSSCYFKCTDSDDKGSDDLSDITSSISEIIRRNYEAEKKEREDTQKTATMIAKVDKYTRPTTNYISSNRGIEGITMNLMVNNVNKQPKQASSSNASSSRKSKKSKQLITKLNDKSNSSNQHSGNNHYKSKLPQTKSKGFHLLHKFVSPNLEISRITMKNYHNSHKRPKLGLFNKGKSSANGISIPELVFSENKFLTRKHYMMAEGKVSSARNSLPSNAKASYNTVLSRKCEEAKNRTPSISKFFSNNNGSHRLSLSPINSAATTNASMLRKKTISSMKSCSNINEALINTGTAVCDRSKTLPSSINERKQTKAVNNTVATGINSTATSVSSQHCSSPVTYRLRNLQDLFAQNQHQQHNDGITDRLTDSFSSQRAQPNQNRRNALDKNNTPLVISVSSLSSSCSNASIKQLLRECQDSILSYCSSNANCNTQYQQNCKPTRAVWKPALQAVSNTPVLQLMPSYAPPRPCYYPSSAFFSNSSSSLVFYNDYNQALDQPQHQMQHRHATATYYKCDNRTTTMSKSKKEGMVYADDSEESCIMYDRFSFAQHYQEQKQQQPTPSTFHPSTPSQCRQQASYYYSHSTTATTDQQQQQSHQYADNQLSSISKTNHNKRNIIAISISSDNSSSVKDSHSFVSPIQDIESNNLKCQIRNNHTLNGKCNNSISYISSRMKSANSNDSDNSSLILLEPTMAVFNDERNSVNDSINDEEEDLNLQNFWLEQSYKRKL